MGRGGESEREREREFNPPRLISKLHFAEPTELPSPINSNFQSCISHIFAAAMEEGEGSSEMEFTNIDTASDSLYSSAIFHVVTDIIGFILFMHQQIPS